MQKYDAIVIGAGHNGLTAAAYLARAGRNVLVLERRHLVGGAAVTEEIFPGFSFSVCSYVVSLLRPEIIRELELARHGLEILPLDGTFTPMLNGNYLWRVNDHARTFREISRHSRRDAEVYDEYGRAMVEMGRFAKDILAMTPPDPFSMKLRELRTLGDLGRRFRTLSDSDRANQLQLLTMSAIDFLDQWFETDVLKATMSASGIIGTFLGVRSPARRTCCSTTTWATSTARFDRGDCRRAAPAASRNRSPRRRVRPARRSSQRAGEAHPDCKRPGDRRRARERRLLPRPAVLSSVDPRLTFLKMVGSDRLPGEFVEDIQRYKFRGSSGKVNLALDGLPDFTCLPGRGAHLRGAISISPSIDYMERAFDDAKYGRFSRARTSTS